LKLCLRPGRKNNIPMDLVADKVVLLVDSLPRTVQMS